MRGESEGGAEAYDLAASSCLIPDEEPRFLEASAPRNRAWLSHYTAQRIQHMLSQSTCFAWVAGSSWLRHALFYHTTQLSAGPNRKDVGNRCGSLHLLPKGATQFKL